VPIQAANRESILRTIVETAEKYGVDPILAVATAIQESNLNPFAIGDNGTSFGLFQLHRGGELGNLTPQEAFVPRTNAEVAISTMAQFQATHPELRGGALAAAAQRPANPSAYALSVDSLMSEAEQLINGIGITIAPKTPTGIGISGDGVGGVATAVTTPAEQAVSILQSFWNFVSNKHNWWKLLFLLIALMLIIAGAAIYVVGSKQFQEAVTTAAKVAKPL
jgi:hypothetical protein